MNEKANKLKYFLLTCIFALAISGTVYADEAETTGENANTEAASDSQTVTASDYADENNWLAIPEITKEVDTFYIYPTAYNDASEGAPEVCDIDSELLRNGAAGCYASQATVYEAATNVFSPYYRQINMVVAASAPAEEREALLQEAPKADLFAALDYYFENLNGGRPFILAAHSQGSQMMTYVLTEYMQAHMDYYDRMVAAYALGYSITDEFLEENPYLKFAEGADDTGVIISWNTEGEGNENADNFVVEKGAIAINPLNWKRDETYAGKEACLGARIQNAETGEYEIIPEAADAQLNTERGVVVTHTDVLEPMAEWMGFGPESYHGGDYTLWYTNIQENVKLRTDTWLKTANRMDVKVIDMEHHYYTQDFYDLAAERDEVPIYYPETNEIEYVDGVVMPLPPADVFWIDDARIEAMDEYGVDQAMLEISPGLELIEGEEGVNLCKAANDLVYEAMQKYPGRFYGSAVLPIRDVEAACKELERCAKEYGFVSWHTHSNYGDSYLDDEQYRPILRKAAELGVYIYLHPTMPVNARINERGWQFSAAGFGFTEDCMATTLAMITRGVFDEIPDLQIVTGHFGEALPFLMDRMDAHLNSAIDEDLFNEHETSYYFRNNIWVTTSGNMSEEAFRCAKDVLGLDRILLGTDYPYETFEEEMEFLYGLDLTDEECEMLYHGNAERLMHLSEYQITDLAGTPSDYSEDDNWLNLPEIEKEVDTFYIYPTANSLDDESCRPMCTIDDENMRAGAQDCLEWQGSAFMEATNVFAPYYRQMNLIDELDAANGHKEGLEAFGYEHEGRTDLYASLDYYFENYNEGRPFILAGHSQGSIMLRIILRDYMQAHPEYYERMIAAYVLGYSITQDDLEKYPYLKFAEGEDDTGVIISWNTEGEENEDNALVWDGALSINPLNWKRDDTYASVDENLGSIQKIDGKWTEVPGVADARVDTERGTVIVTTREDYIDLNAICGYEEPAFGTKSLHGGDYQYFYGNIKENVQKRSDAWFAQGAD